MARLTRRDLFKVGAGAVPAIALSAQPATAETASRNAVDAISAVSERASAGGVHATGHAPPELAAFDKVVQTYMTERDISCGQLALVKDGRLVLARGYSLNADIPVVRPTSLFRIASLTKNITAAAILRLVEDGRLALDDRVHSLLGLSTKADPRLADVSLLRLMQHTGGWDRGVSPDYLWIPRTIAKALGVPLPIDHQDIIDYTSTKPLDFDPGSRMVYSNYGYLLLGRVIEKASGQSYESYVREKLLAPAGIGWMRIGRNLREDAAPSEVPYYSQYTDTTVLDDSGTVVPYPYGGFDMRHQDANGGWIASAIDLVRWAGVFDDPGLVLSAKSISTAFAVPEVGVGAGGSWYGCGWHARQVTGHVNTWHSGSMPGTYSYLARLQRGVTYAAIFNRREETGTPDYDVLSPRMNNAWGTITSWPTTDLYPDYF